MLPLLLALFTASTFSAALAAASESSSAIISLTRNVPADASSSVPKDFGSISIEYAFFADYGGNLSHPTVFSINLLSNVEKLTGVMPMVRAGVLQELRSTVLEA
ncbi:hypothetical protein P167DRAFT_579995 [Morchella conica CCBAS932]|uniref:Uncharacterized protein n=1 Tax=Morchella conica CCBAS932 TaxID=1392247 RepID=A0A3N4K8G7_9PEZI|nr:hypothetical protein P167DRAFT_579995 [Morchella conica CCBAS932]